MIFTVMKRGRRLLIALIAFFAIGTVGCQDQILDKQPTSFFSGKDIWGNIDMVEKYVIHNYDALGGWRINSAPDTPEGEIRGDGNAMPASLTDDAYLQFNYLSIWDFNAGRVNPDNLTIFRAKWSNCYKYIKNCNRFFEHIDEVKADESVKKNLEGQMLFLRAFEYARLLNLFGGVPIITKTFTLDDNYKVKRDSYKEGITWVVGQLDKAATMVPETVPADQWGRITKGAVLALKSRVLLYAASKLHDPTSVPNGPLYSYDVQDKWEQAAKAAKAVIDLGLYSLVQVNTWEDYHQIFMHRNSEIIFAKPFSSQYAQYGTNIDQINTPNGYGGWSGNNVTQNVVEAFQMKDGKSINESPLYDPSPDSIYKNRELRFYADVVYNGAMFRGRKAEFYLPGGKDSPDGPQGWNAGKTGYSMRKHMDESLDFKSSSPTTPRIFFRLAGIYLNYAEAEYHLGNESVAREYVNKVRERVHLPDINSSGEQLLDDIRHERRIELVFEGYNRFNDLRRWMLAGKYLSEDAKGIAWKKVDQNGDLSPNGKLTYSIITVQQRNFPNKMYYLPIPRSEVQKSGLKQNTGYN